MPVSPDHILKAIQTIESQLALIKESLGDMSVNEGRTGLFDGEYVQLDDGTKYPIPPNYASKSMLVPGDTLRMINDPNGGDQHRFKQIAKIERAKANGIVTRKDGKFEVVCEEGSFKVLMAAIKHFEAQPGDTVTIQFAKHHTKGSWAAIEKVIKTQGQGDQLESRQSNQLQSPIASSTIAHASEKTSLPTEINKASQQQAQTQSSSKIPAVSSRSNKSDTQKQNRKSVKTSSKPTNPNRMDVKPTQVSDKTESSGQENSLPVQQGEITVPLVMDEDDLT